jgi:HEAT repeat protein
MKSGRLLCFALMALWVLAAGANGEAEKKMAQPIFDCYVTTGDNYWMSTWLPIDSEAAINASFDLLKDAWGMRRVYWRGLEMATWLDTCEFRAENRQFDDYWKWARHLGKEVGVDRLAVAAAHKRGMEIWGVGSLFDWGSGPDVGWGEEFPYQSESRLRIEHPKWVPVDRHGFRKQSGCIELAYPEARKALMDIFVKHVLEAGYDGMALLTYVETFSMRFQDEFGFSEPIVQEFKKRYGVDIRTEKFDRHAWYDLRGEYVTQFMREMKAALAAHGKKLGIFLDSREPNYPLLWGALKDLRLLTAGRIYLDIERWIREGIVDELLVWGNCPRSIQVRTLENCLQAARQTGTKVSIFSSGPHLPEWKPYQERGVATCIWAYDEKMYVEGNVAEQSLSSLKASDSKLRMRALAQVITGSLRAGVSDVAPLADDTDPLVRRLALLALGTLKDAQAAPVLEKALGDRENCVRSVAAHVMKEISGPDSAEKILAAVERFGTFPFCEEAVTALSRMKPAPTALLMKAATSDSVRVRTVAVRTLGGVAWQEALPSLVKALDDPDAYVRWAAVKGIGHFRRQPKAVEVQIAATRHEDLVVQDRAAVSLGRLMALKDPETVPMKPQVLEALTTLFKKFGDGCTRPDAEWGFRPVGNALVALGPEGEAALNSFMSQRTDKRLADLAWRVLWIRQKPGELCPVTEKEDAEAFAKRPAR